MPVAGAVADTFEWLARASATNGAVGFAGSKRDLNAALAANPVAGPSIRPAARGYRPIPNEKTSSRALLEVFGGLHKVVCVSLRLEPDVLKAGATPYYLKKLPE